MYLNIVDYGEIADCKIINTVCIQEAIDECYKSGGGKVLVPAGVTYIITHIL